MSYKLHNLESYLQVGRDIDVDQIQSLEETVEILKEQINSLELELCYKNEELEEIKEELSYTNHELCAVYELYASSSDLLTINEVKNLAKNFLPSEKPA